jgi:hypothetical protein
MKPLSDKTLVNRDEVFKILEQIKDENNLEEYLEESIISNIEYYLPDIFSSIPKDTIEDELLNLYQLVLKWNSNKISKLTDEYAQQTQKEIEDIIKKVNKTLKKRNATTPKKIDRKPSQQIKQDIGTIKKYQEMVHRLYGARNKTTKEYTLFNAPKEIQQSYFNNQKVLKDIENSEFQIVTKSKYYETIKPTKTDIKTFMEDVRDKYNLKGVSFDIKQFIDSIQQI